MVVGCVKEVKKRSMGHRHMGMTGLAAGLVAGLGSGLKETVVGFLVV